MHGPGKSGTPVPFLPLQNQGTGMDSEWQLPGFIEQGTLPGAVVGYGGLRHESGCASC